MPRPVRIAYFITALETGGSERSLLQLLQGLPSAEYEKHVICLSGFGPLEEAVRATGATLHDVGYPRLRAGGRIQWKRLPGIFLTLPRLLSILLKIRPQILHTMIPVCNVLGALAAVITRTPCLVCSKLSLGIYRDKNRLLALLEDRTDPWFDLIHCKSQGIVDDLIQREPVDVGRTRVVYNGLDVAPYEKAASERNAARDALGIPHSAPVIGMVANLWPYKGHLDVVEAAGTLAPSFPNLRLLFIGRDEGMGNAILERAQNLGIERTIILAGERSDIPLCMSAMDVLVSASHEEGFSNVLLEGMASGLPIVATRVGGNPEAVLDDITGYLVPVQAPREMARALRALLDDPAMARMMGQAGHDRVVQRFSRRAMVDGMRALYEELGVPVTK